MNSEGLTTTAAPACRAGIESPSAIASGKFQGLMTPTTGKGRYWMTQLLRGQQRRVGTDALVADVLGRLGAVEVDQVGDVAEVERDVGCAPCRFRPASCRRSARCCRGSSRAACRASGSGPRSRSPPTRPGWRARGRRWRRRTRASRSAIAPISRPGRGVEDVDRSRRRRGGAVHRPVRLGAGLGGAALHWVLPSSTLGWSANCSRPGPIAGAESRAQRGTRRKTGPSSEAT